MHYFSQLLAHCNAVCKLSGQHIALRHALLQVLFLVIFIIPAIQMLHISCCIANKFIVKEISNFGLNFL